MANLSCLGKEWKGAKGGGKNAVPEKHEEKFWMNAQGKLIRIDPDERSKGTTSKKTKLH